MKTLRDFCSTMLAGLLVSGLAFAHLGGGAREALTGTTYTNAMAQAASGWTYNGTQSLSLGDIAVPTDSKIYLNGTTRSHGVTYDGTDIKVLGVAPITPVLDQGLNLGKPAVRWSNLYLAELNMGVSSARTLIASAPAIAAACTSPTVTHGNTISFQMDVGTGCAVSVVTLTLSAASNGWACGGRNITGGLTRGLKQTGAVSTTSVTLTSVDAAGAATNFVDGDDLAIDCVGR